MELHTNETHALCESHFQVEKRRYEIYTVAQKSNNVTSHYLLTFFEDGVEKKRTTREAKDKNKREIRGIHQKWIAAILKEFFTTEETKGQ